MAVTDLRRKSRGLFDARGNLVGITTLILTGRELLNQSLNFAIPADSFFQK